MNKHDLEQRIATLADGGVIAEIGVGVGNGIKALHAGTTLGRMLRIFAVDPYAPYRDLNGAEYGPDSEAQFMALLAGNPQLAKDVTLLKQDGVTAGKEWPGYPVAMVWIDMTDPADTLREIALAWKPHIVPGGYLCLNNLEYTFRGCGAREVSEYLLSFPGWHAVDIEGQQGAAILQRDTPRRAVFYVVNNDGFVKEAEISARSARRYLQSADTVLLCQPGAAVDNATWCHVYPVMRRTHKTWYCDEVAYILRAMELMEDYQELLYLDCDTILARSCDELWLVLQQAEFAFGHGAERDHNQSIYGAPAAFTTPMVGVNLFRNNARVREFARRWLALYEAHEAFYGENDQYPLRDLLWTNEVGLRYVVLPGEFACRHNFGVSVKGMVRVMHGRLPNLDKTLEQAAAEINADHTMRLWHPRFGLLWSVNKEQAGEMR